MVTAAYDQIAVSARVPAGHGVGCGPARHRERPSTTATACYVARRGGVTVPLAPLMLLPYDCCCGDGAAGDGPGLVAGRGAGGLA